MINRPNKNDPVDHVTDESSSDTDQTSPYAPKLAPRSSDLINDDNDAILPVFKELIYGEEKKPSTLLHDQKKSVEGDQQKKIGVPCFVSEKLAIAIKKANLGIDYDAPESLYLEKPTEAESRERDLLLNQFGELIKDPGFTLLPINITNYPSNENELDQTLSDIDLEVMDIDLDEIEVFTKLNNDIYFDSNNSDSDTIFFIGNYEELNTKKQEMVKSRFNTILRNMKAKKVNQNQINNMSDEDFPDPELVNLFEKKSQNSILDNLTMEFATQLNNNKKYKGKYLIRSIIGLLLLAKDQMGIARLLTKINQAIDYHSDSSSGIQPPVALIALLKKIRESILDYKVNHILPLDLTAKKTTDEVQLNFARIERDLSSVEINNNIVKIFSITDLFTTDLTTEQKVIRLCGLTKALCQAKNEKNKRIGDIIKAKYLAPNIISKNEKSPLYQIQAFLIRLLEVDTVNTKQKNDLIQKLNAFLNNPNMDYSNINDVKAKFNIIIDQSITDLKLNTENAVSSLFNWKGLHRLRNFIEEERKKINEGFPVIITPQDLINTAQNTENKLIKAVAYNDFFESGGSTIGQIKYDLRRRLTINNKALPSPNNPAISKEKGGKETQEQQKEIEEMMTFLMTQLDNDEKKVDKLIKSHSQGPAYLVTRILAASFDDGESETSLLINPNTDNVERSLNYIYNNNEFSFILYLGSIDIQDTQAGAYISRNIDTTVKYQYKDRGELFSEFYKDGLPNTDEIKANTYVFFKENDTWQCGFKNQNDFTRIPLTDLPLPSNLTKELNKEFDVSKLIDKASTTLKENSIYGYYNEEENKLAYRIKKTSADGTKIIEDSLEIEGVNTNWYNHSNREKLKKDALAKGHLTYDLNEDDKKNIRECIQNMRYGFELVDVKTTDPFVLRAFKGEHFTVEQVKELVGLNNPENQIKLKH